MYHTPNIAVLQGRNHARPRLSGMARLRGLGALGLQTSVPSPISHPSGPYSLEQNLNNLMAQQAVVDQNPTDYSSPEGAIAAGLDPTMVYAAWAKGLSQYPTQEAAVNAGIMPGVVTRLWAQSRQVAQLNTTPNYGPLVAIGAVIAALIFLHVGDKGGAA